MKTISLKLSKRLNELWLLDDVETEYLYVYEYLEKNKWEIVKSCDFCSLNPTIKTLTLEEAIEKLIEYLLDDNLLFKK